MKTHDAQAICPHCGTETDAMTNPGGVAGPKPGSITICVYCFEPSRLDDQMRMQKLDWNELPPKFRSQLREVIKRAKARLPS